jgi:murein DD-endopeptidase
VCGINGRRSLSCVIVRTVFVLQIAFLLMTQCFARERGPRVEVVCPSPPIPATIDKNKVLVYELHVTNFDTVPLTLKSVEILANEESKEPLVTLERDKLSAAMIRVGAAMMMSSGSSGAVQDTRIIDPGGRNVVFVWIELPVNRTVPASLKHRLVFSSTPAGASDPSDATLEGFQVPVTQYSVPILSPPFTGGIWLAGDGPVNNSNHRRSIFAIDGHIYSPERFAIDWVKVGSNGDSRHDGTTKNENWWGWGEPVLAVADGEIMEVVDEFPDNTPRVLPPVTLDNIAGNRIILQIAHNRFVTYAHLQRGSIKVAAGDHVHRGDVLALLGNSGNTTGAHLHLQVTDRNSVLQSQGVPFVFADFTYLGPGADYPEKQVSVPWLNSIPPGNGVVKFAAVKK